MTSRGSLMNRGIVRSVVIAIVIAALRRRTVLAGTAAALLLVAGTSGIEGSSDVRAAAGANGEVRSVFVHLPPTASALGRLRVLVVLHGMGGNGEDFSRDFLATAEGNGWLVIAPTISYGDWTDPAQVASEEPALIEWLSKYLDVLPSVLAQNLAPRVLLVGHSRGAQLALRFAEFHPERVRGVAALAAGTYTLPFSVDAADHPMRFPFGIADLPDLDGGGAFDSGLFATVPIWIGVGGNDANPTDLPRAWDPYLGATRVQRARAFATAMRQLNAPVSVTEFPSVDHTLTAEMRQVACVHLRADENTPAGGPPSAG